MTYDPHLDSRLSYEAAIAAARADYLANRREGETAAQYIERRRRERE